MQCPLTVFLPTVEVLWKLKFILCSLSLLFSTKFMLYSKSFVVISINFIASSPRAVSLSRNHFLCSWIRMDSLSFQLYDAVADCRRLTSIFKEVLLWLKTLTKGTACSREICERKSQRMWQTSLLSSFQKLPYPPQPSATINLDQSADIDTETRPSTSKKILTCEDRDDAQTTLF